VPGQIVAERPQAFVLANRDDLVEHRGDQVLAAEGERGGLVVHGAVVLHEGGQVPLGAQATVRSDAA
jgi:hypothetical protein